MENKSQTIEIKIKYSLTLDIVEAIIIGAMEGGSNYWYYVKSEEFKKDLVGTSSDPITERICKTLMSNPEFKMNVYDLEGEGDNLLGTLTQKSLINSFSIVSEKYPHHFNDLMNDSHDAITSDVFFQVAVMGDIIFG